MVSELGREGIWLVFVKVTSQKSVYLLTAKFDALSGFLLN